MEPAACRGQQVSKEPQEVAQTLNYEVQFLENRDWKIEAAYQDRQAALEVAEDLVHAPGFSKVRVVEETHDDDTGKTETKTVPAIRRAPRPHRRQPYNGRWRAGRKFLSLSCSPAAIRCAIRAEKRPVRYPTPPATAGTRSSRPHNGRWRAGRKSKLRTILSLSCAARPLRRRNRPDPSRRDLLAYRTDRPILSAPAPETKRPEPNQAHERSDHAESGAESPIPRKIYRPPRRWRWLNPGVYRRNLGTN